MKLKMLKNIMMRNEEGAVIVIIALFMTVLIGMGALVLDMGISFNESSKLQKAMDSAALAATRELPISSKADWEIKVEKAAKKYAELNGVEDLDGLIINPIYQDGKPFNKNDITSDNLKGIRGVQIIGKKEVKYNFSRIFGQNDSVINKEAQARLMAVDAMSGLLPIALPEELIDKMANGTITTLKYGADKDMDPEVLAIYNTYTNKTGWRGAVDFLDEDGKIATTGKYKEAMEAGGYPGLVSIGDIQQVDAGVMSLKDTPIKVGDIVYVPVVSPYDSKKNIEVVGFAAVEIMQIDDKITAVKYIKSEVVSGSVGYIGGVKLNDYGVRAVKLVN